MSIKDWKNGRKLNLRDPDVSDMFSIEFDYTDSNDELLELELRRNKSKINQAR